MSGTKRYIENQAGKMADYIMTFTEVEESARGVVWDVAAWLGYRGHDCGAGSYADLLIYHSKYLGVAEYRLYIALFITDHIFKIDAEDVRELTSELRLALYYSACAEQKRLIAKRAEIIEEYIALND